MDAETTPRIVSMRHFSCRVEGKNYRLLGNKPLHRYDVDTLLTVHAISAVVSTT